MFTSEWESPCHSLSEPGCQPPRKVPWGGYCNGVNMQKDGKTWAVQAGEKGDGLQPHQQGFGEPCCRGWFLILNVEMSIWMGPGIQEFFPLSWTTEFVLVWYTSWFLRWFLCSAKRRNGLERWDFVVCRVDRGVCSLRRGRNWEPALFKTISSWGMTWRCQEEWVFIFLF